MQFKHPEILYSLFLLIIPIIVHLFQLQRFSKVPFTNVDFLRQIKQQTRKSSYIKKWLILISRMLIFSAIILAFSQPFFSNHKKNIKNLKFIYLDNSLSMQQKNNNGELLKIAAQQIIENVKKNEILTLITNDKILKKISYNELKNELINIKYSPKKLDFKTLSLKINQLIQNTTKTINNIILISDFQNVNKINKLDVTNVNTTFSLIKTQNTTKENLSIDSLFISNKNIKEITLKILISNKNIENKSIPISLYNDENLISKKSISLVKNKSTTVEFKIPNQKKFNGKIEIQDSNLMFDNQLFFSIPKFKKINILSIGKSSNFLNKIYSKDEFNFSSQTPKSINFSSINKFNLIILNEIDHYSIELINQIKKYIDNGGNLVIVPSLNYKKESYQLLFNALQLGTIDDKMNQKSYITKINFDHFIFNNVFEKQIQNFDYPTVNQSIKFYLNNSTPILKYSNEESFVSEIIKNNNGSVFLFNSSLSLKNSNFQNSPLIVPLFYNFGKISYQIPQLYYTITQKNTIDIDTPIKNNDLIKINTQNQEIIPQQIALNTKTRININDLITKSGFYNLTKNTELIETLAFNYNRKENDLNYADLDNIFKNKKNITISNNIKKVFQNIYEHQEIKPLFKWFIGLAILFLLIEMCILKFFKI